MTHISAKSPAVPFKWDAVKGDFPSREIGQSLLVHADCFEWLAQIPEHSLHAIVTDPPYGVKEYNADQLAKRSSQDGGVWRIPPSFDGNMRSPLPRFTALNNKERQAIRSFLWSGLKQRCVGCAQERMYSSHRIHFCRSSFLKLLAQVGLNIAAC